MYLKSPAINQPFFVIILINMVKAKEVKKLFEHN
jgi:hypothetical protein